MASGFVQRFKGKIQVDGIWHKGWDLSSVLTQTAGSTNYANSNVILASASAASVFSLGPPETGVEMRLMVTSVSSGIFVKAFPGTNFGVFGGTTEIVMKSTTLMTIEMVGISTVAWQIRSVWSTSTSVIPQPTFSTTT